MSVSSGMFPSAGSLLAGDPAHHFVLCPRELDEEISADLADEVGAAPLDRLVLRHWDLRGGATGRGWLSESGMSLWLERGWQGWGDGDVGINKDEKNKEEYPFQLAFTEPGRQGRACV